MIASRKKHQVRARSKHGRLNKSCTVVKGQQIDEMDTARLIAAKIHQNRLSRIKAALRRGNLPPDEMLDHLACRDCGWSAIKNLRGGNILQFLLADKTHPMATGQINAMRSNRLRCRA